MASNSLESTAYQSSSSDVPARGDREARRAPGSGDYRRHSMPWLLRWLVHRFAFWPTQSGVVLHECRRCGTTLSSREATCPYCRVNDVATYVIE